MKELDLIRWIRDRVGTPSTPVVGIGDDAAVMSAPAGGRIVVTTDLIVEGTHFLPGDPPRDVGFKSVAVSLSDVAAMGCRPTGVFLAVALRRDLAEETPLELLEGAIAAADGAGAALLGGDTTETAGPLVLCSTVVGEPPAGGSPVRRSGARPGQILCVTGALGGSREGRHLRFAPRNREALELVSIETPGAMIDLSDGLSTDAGHLARESGARIRIHATRIPVSDAARRTADPLRSALNDGEDFELLFSVSAPVAERLELEGLAGTPVTRVGVVVTGAPGVFLVRADGTEEELRAGGYEHFGS